MSHQQLNHYGETVPVPQDMRHRKNVSGMEAMC